MGTAKDPDEIARLEQDARQLASQPDAGHRWQIEKAFRISKTDLRIRPIYHRQKRRIEAHICIAFVAYAIYKELERLLKRKGIEMSVKRAGEPS